MIHRPVLHALPENCKSQYVYLRPDLGTDIYSYHGLGILGHALDISLQQENTTDDQPVPALSGAAQLHIAKFLSWDLSYGEIHG